MTARVCTSCGEPLAEDVAYLAVFLETGGGFSVRIGCEHLPVADLDGAEAVLGSVDCLLAWIEQRARAWRGCGHRADEVVS